MPTSDNDSRTPKTPRKRAASPKTPAAGETPVRKRTSRKTVEAPAPHSASVTEAARLAAAAISSIGAARPVAAPSKPALSPASPSASSVDPAAKSVAAPVPGTASLPASAGATAASARPVPVVTGTRPDPVLAMVVGADERLRMIQEAAYHKFVQRGPGNGSPAQDWLEAEAEIDALLAEQRIDRTQ